MNKAIGEKIKQLRQDKKMTLKDLSDASELSTGFLSQLERGMSSIAVDTLGELASILDVDLSYFFDQPKERDTYIQRHFERTVFQIENNNFIHYHLTTMAEHSDMLPRMIELLPGQFDDPMDEYPHAGEEFVYVIEGVLSLFIDGERKDLYPTDIAHYPSSIKHNWANYTNKMVKLLVVSSHNPFNSVHKA